MRRKTRIDQIQARIGKRKLIWFGTRSTDARALFEIPQFSEIFSIIAPINSGKVQEVSLEALKKQRVDLDLYSLDIDSSNEAIELRRVMSQSMKSPTAVVTYRPGNFFTSLYYPNIEHVQYLGLFHEQQAPFEHKPWVESELKKIGIPVIPWKYYNTENFNSARSNNWPVVVRANRSDGGTGLSLVENPDELIKFRPKEYGKFIGVAPFMEPNIPLNVNACVFPNGSVSIHSLSFQMIGIKELTNRQFGYCGNDFSVVKDLDLSLISDLEKIVILIGKWLSEHGYRGAFGIDLLVFKEKLFLTEINPRFQGSSDVSAKMNQLIDRSDIFLEHMAAFLNLQSPKTISLRDILDEQLSLSQVILHNINNRVVQLGKLPEKEITSEHKLDLLPNNDILIQPDAVLCRFVVDGSATQDGHKLTDSLQQEVLKTNLLYT